MTKTARAKYRINLPIHGHKAGTVLRLKVDEHGTPLERKWRRRLRDAKIDNCISLIEDKPQPKKAPQKKTDSPSKEK